MQYQPLFAWNNLSMAHTPHGHVHSHGLSPHPAQPPRWSLLRMSVGARLGAAACICVALWIIVLLAVR